MDVIFPRKDRLSIQQEAVLKAYVDALLPPLIDGIPNVTMTNSTSTTSTNTLNENEESLRRFWEYRLSDDPEYIKTVSVTILQKLSIFDRCSILLLLSFMHTMIGTCILFHQYQLKCFIDYNEYDRTNLLLPSLQYSTFVIRRKIFQSFKRLLCGIAFTYHTTTSSSSSSSSHTKSYLNPFWDAIGYPGSPMDWYNNQSIDQQRVELAIREQQPIIEALQHSKEQIQLQAKSSPKDINNEIRFECDIVIVGSGSGGCVAAQVLSKAGYDVIVLEKGTYLSPTNITQHEIHSMDQQYAQSGLLQNTSGTIMILAGSALGGGTAINWGCCLPLPQYVRNDWENDKHQLHETFSGAEYDVALNHILDKLGVNSRTSTMNGKNNKSGISSTKTIRPHNTINRKLQEGCTKLGYQWEETGQVKNISS
jgi:long-chain-alcohol oxidase